MLDPQNLNMGGGGSSVRFNFTGSLILDGWIKLISAKYHPHCQDLGRHNAYSVKQ